MNHIIDRISKTDDYREEQIAFYGSPEVFVSDFNPIQIEIPGFSNVWVHSEHKNETGTHKDRKALTLAYYMKMLAGHPEMENHLPISDQVYSIITSGSAGISLGNAIKKIGGPSLRVLVGNLINQNILDVLEDKGCEIYKTELSNEELSGKDILRLTNNSNGIDLTSQHDQIFINSYFQLAYSIVYGDNSGYDHIITPYGTGELYNAITLLSLGDIERFSDYIDYVSGIPYFIPYTTGKPISIWGSSTDNVNSKMDKLYAPNLPFLPGLQGGSKQWGPIYTLDNLLPHSKKLKNTKVINISDNHLDEATEIFKNYNIPAEPSALSSLALLLENPDRFKPDEKILLVSTGKCKK